MLGYFHINLIIIRLTSSGVGTKIRIHLNSPTNVIIINYIKFHCVSLKLITSTSCRLLLRDLQFSSWWQCKLTSLTLLVAARRTAPCWESLISKQVLYDCYSSWWFCSLPSNCGLISSRYTLGVHSYFSCVCVHLWVIWWPSWDVGHGLQLVIVNTTCSIAACQLLGCEAWRGNMVE